MTYAIRKCRFCGTTDIDKLKKTKVGKILTLCNRCNYRHYPYTPKTKRIYKPQYKTNKPMWINFLIESGISFSCSECGYNKYTGAIEFHHIDSKQKELSMNQFMRSRELSDLNKTTFLQEVSKCLILCSNCHKELHHELRKNKAPQ